MGYSLLHKGYKCLHSSTGRIYISRDVIFKKTHFPFLNSSPSSSISSQSTESFMLMVTKFGSAHSPISTSSIPSLTLPTHFTIPSPILQNPTQSAPIQDTLHPPPVNPISSSIADTSSASSIREPTIQLQSAPTIQPQPTVQPTHPMPTRSKNNISKPKHHTDGTIRYPSPTALLAEHDFSDSEPTCYSTACKFPEWREAMNKEFDALLKKKKHGSLFLQRLPPMLLSVSGCFASNRKLMVL